jgi:ABC-type transport system involved in multi-copper enzyme maturation permease subunit
MRARIILTLKQHRFETITAVVLCLGVAIAGLVEAYRLNSIQFPAGCVPSGGYNFDPMRAPTPCDAATKAFYDLLWSFDMNLVKLFEQLLPFIVGVTFGAVLVAREIEQGTAPLSWALAGSRRRWLAGKLLAVVILIVPLLLIAGLAADVREGATNPGIDPHASFYYYADRGVFLVFWGLAALCGTVALGTITGRTLPAVLLALVVCVLARGMWEQAWNRTILRQIAVAQDTNGSSRWGTDLWVYQTNEYYLDGKVWTGDINVWFDQNLICAGGPTPAPSASPSAAPSSDMAVPIGPKCMAGGTLPGNLAPPMPITYVIPGNQYWPVVALESAVLFVGAVFCAAVALVWVERRRPY